MKFVYADSMDYADPGYDFLRGALRQEDLVALERRALDRVRAYDRDEADLDETLDAVMAYATPAILGAPVEALPGSKAFKDLRTRYWRTLVDRPWQKCRCAICTALSVEVILFRASNRNKRRGIHNLGVFKTLVHSLSQGAPGDDDFDLFGNPCSAESGAQRAVIRGESLGPVALCGD